MLISEKKKIFNFYFYHFCKYTLKRRIGERKKRESIEKNDVVF